MTHLDIGRTLSTTGKSLEIVDYLMDHGPVGVTELAETFDMPKSTVHQHLTTLRYHGFLVKKENEYHLGLKFLCVGTEAKSQDRRYQAVEERLHNLVDNPYDEADFNVEEHGRLISLLTEVGPDNDPIYDYYYMHTTAVGKAMLAEYPDHRVRAIIDRWGLPKQTEKTITDEGELWRELDEVRERGFGVSEEELNEGFRAIGMLIHDSEGGILGGVSLGQPTYRADEEMFFQNIPEKLFDFVEEIERVIEGYDRYQRQ
ncbi:IclR family transcriptional regulator [Haloplanus pelagicus]|uniref:IclR family transcriptional regulator n=1 Tax=Haloplanus pelagicus TaxID=2949995 RepID=UPI00203F962C|nr:IclR family transcriptional regulator [Haloplanus sp. HW8-1]